MPGRPSRVGNTHILQQTTDKIIRVLGGLGFQYVEGPELEAFKYNFPYDMDLNVLDGSATWSPTLTVGWTVTMQNTVTLALPPKPEAGEESVALAEYNANHLTFLTTF